MEVIPVLDLMEGRVVHGVQGDRERYRPIQSTLTPSSEPLKVAQVLKRVTGCEACYVADLDAIQGHGNHEKILRTLADRAGVDLWVDAAITDPPSASRLLQAGAARVIVGSETLPSLKTLRKIRDSVLPEQMLFSLDVGSGGVLSTCATLQSLQPLAALDLLSREGLSQVILLTLNRVGTESGPDWSILESSRATFPHLSLIAGGGVRSPDDMWRLAEMGVDGALIATALHRGSITAADIDKIRLSR